MPIEFLRNRVTEFTLQMPDGRFVRFPDGEVSVKIEKSEEEIRDSEELSNFLEGFQLHNKESSNSENNSLQQM